MPVLEPHGVRSGATGYTHWGSLHSHWKSEAHLQANIGVTHAETAIGKCARGRFWDWKSGHNFQAGQTVVQPGSLESEAGIFAAGFDGTGTRLLTTEADKSVKFWKEVCVPSQSLYPDCAERGIVPAMQSAPADCQGRQGVNL